MQVNKLASKRDAARLLIREVQSETEAADEQEKAMTGGGLLASDGMTDAMIEEGKEKELSSIRHHEVYEEVPIPANAKCIRTRWVLRRKGPGCKARLVVKDLKRFESPDYFAPTPSLSSLRLLLAHSSWNRCAKPSSSFVIRVCDVSTAFLNAPIGDGQVVCVLPPHDVNIKEGCCWLLKKALYGLRQAPKLWAEHLSSLLTSLGFVRSQAEPSMYAKDDTLILVHVDDLVFSGPQSTVQHVITSLQESLQLTVGEPLQKDGDACSMLGRTITRLPVGYSLCGDESLSRLSIVELGLEKAKPMSTPSVVESTLQREESKPLSPAMHTEYRKHVGRLAYIALDRLDLQYTSKHLARALASPTELDFTSLKRAFRYLLYRPTLKYIISPTTVPTQLDVYTDSDWGSCKKSRRSTSGCIACVQGCVLSHYSRTQATIALSSAEAELTSCVSAAAEGLFLQSVFAEIGVHLRVVIHCDSKACIDHCKKLGLGKMKHIHLRSCFVQELLSSKRIVLQKIAGEDNPSDLLTKAVVLSVMRKLMSSSLLSLDVKEDSFLDVGDCPTKASSWSLESHDDADVRLMKFVL